MISVVIPLYDEEKNVPALYEKLLETLDSTGLPHEIIFCDDGSRDNTLKILKEIASKDKSVKVISFTRNFGQTAAMEAGFLHAKGDVIIPMDGDLQNDPSDIPALIAKLAEGCDVVSGWRRQRKDAFFTKTFPSRIANFIISRITKVHIHDYGCTLKAYRSSILKDFRLYGEMHRLIPAYVQWAGGRIAEIEVKHHPRQFGRPKYTLRKSIRVILDLLTVKFLLAYSTKPIYFIGKYGLLFISLGILSFCWTLIKKISWGEPVYTDPFFLIGIFLTFTGIQVVFFGLNTELLMRTYFESQKKFPYLIKEKINFTNNAGMPRCLQRG
jgi:glycosyltransferase involved in cell wall biosynthesis